LKAEIVHQPVEQGSGIVSVDGATQILVAKFIHQIKRASEATNLVNQTNGIIDSSRVETDEFSR
jgi:hypothetical protein